MAIKINGTTVISDQRELQNVSLGDVDISDTVRTPTLTSPTTSYNGQASDMTLTSSDYYSLYGLPQGGTEFQLDNNSDFSSPILDQDVSGTSNSYTWDWRSASALSASTTYYVRARQYDNAGTYSPWSDVVTFTTANVLNFVHTPSITSPANGATNLMDYVAFSADTFASTPSGDTHVSSDWQISTSSSFATLHNSVTGDTTNKTSWTNTVAFDESTTYYIRVRYNGASYGTSEWSTAVSFTTAVVFQGEQTYTTAGTYTFTVPTGVTSISYVAVDGGMAGFGNDSGQSYNSSRVITQRGGNSYVAGTGNPDTFNYGGNAGHGGNTGNNTFHGGGGGGGAGGYEGTGGDGATGWGDTTATAGAGIGGGGGGGGRGTYCTYNGHGGGGVGLFGNTGNGTSGGGRGGSGGGGGSGGTAGYTSGGSSATGHGGTYGGGGAGAGANSCCGGGGGGSAITYASVFPDRIAGSGIGADNPDNGVIANFDGGDASMCHAAASGVGGGLKYKNNISVTAGQTYTVYVGAKGEAMTYHGRRGGDGGGGAVRIIWPGNTRSFPTTNVGAS